MRADVGAGSAVAAEDLHISMHADENPPSRGDLQKQKAPHARQAGAALWKVAREGLALNIPTDPAGENASKRLETVSEELQGSQEKRAEAMLRRAVSSFKRAESLSAASVRAVQLASDPSLISATKVHMFGGSKHHRHVIGHFRQTLRHHGLRVILDVEPWYQVWFIVTVVAACVQGWVTPYMLAFHGRAGWGTWDFYTAFHALTCAMFLVDLVLNFYVSKIVDNKRIADPWEIRRIYLRGMFWVDVVSSVPYDAIVLAAMNAAGWPHTSWEAGGFANLLVLLTLLRLHRVLRFFHYLEINITVSHLTITLIRNLVYVLYVIHWSACLFYYIALQERFSDESWVAINASFFQGLNTFQTYLICIYWSTTMFAGGGTDLQAHTVPEAVFSFCYLLLNVALGAYIIGTITLLVVRHDEEASSFRNTMQELQEYCKDTHINQALRDDIHTYLEMKSSRQGKDDEHITHGLPATLRRRVLRNVYHQCLQSCYLFRTQSERTFPQKFLDALLAAAHVEVFLPMVDIITDMETVNELYIVVSGAAGVYRRLSLGLERDQLLLDERNHSVYAADMWQHYVAGQTGAAESPTKLCKDVDLVSEADSHAPAHELSQGSPFGEVSFFTLQPSRQTVKAGVDDGCKALVIPREKYASICVDYPHAARMVLENLQNRLHQTMRLHRSSLHTVSVDPDAPVEVWDDMAEMDEVKMAVERLLLKDSERHINAFLAAAAQGDFYGVKAMLDKGQNVNCTDYDNRTALMLAAVNGHQSLVKQLVDKGANMHAIDNFGATALLQAVEKGQEAVMDLLIQRGAKLLLSQDRLAGKLCQLVQDQAQAHLRRYFRAGADPNVSDYDKRTALHIAAAEGNLSMVKLLVMAGADMAATDRWGATALDEALRVGAAAVVEYMESVLGEGVSGACRRRLHDRRTQDMLVACTRGHAGAVKKLLDEDCPPDTSDYDNRTGLMLAAAEGHLHVAELLLSHHANPNLQHRQGGTALLEACRHQRPAVVRALTAAGGRLGMSDGKLASLLCQSVHARDYAVLRLLLEAGANPDAADYDRRTALMVAAAEGNLRMVQLLTTAHASVTLADRWGNTAVSEAEAFKHQHVAEYLRSRQAEVPSPL